MRGLHVILLLIYMCLIVSNFYTYKRGYSSVILTLITAALSTILLFSSNVADLDWSQTELDISGTRMLYEGLEVNNHEEYNTYFLFYRCMYLGQILGISFRGWWAIMSVIMMIVVFLACKVHNYSYNLFLATFMIFYEPLFFGGLKSFYAFCFFILAYGFLLKNTRNGRLLFILFNLIASGFHIMFYLFFFFLIRPSSRPKFLVNTIVSLTIIITIIIRLSGSAQSFIAPFVAALDNEHIAAYTTLNSVGLGFYAALFLHLLTIYIVYRIRNFQINSIGKPSVICSTLFDTALLSVVFCPLYAVALTFMRYITFYSFAAIIAGSCVLNDNYKSRTFCLRMTLLMVVTSYIIRGAIGFSGLVESCIIPFFDVF